MSFGGDEGSEVGYATARGRDWPSVRQFNVFVENRLGGLMSVVRRFESSDNRIISLMVVDSADCAIIRIVVADPVLIHPLGAEALALHVEDIESAATTLTKQGFVLFTEGDFLSP